ncbi:MAG: mechanosensitive ion channel family protein [Pseudomonadota bacterium]
MGIRFLSLKDGCLRRNAVCLLALLMAIVFVLIGVAEPHAQQDTSSTIGTQAETSTENQLPVEPIRTESPRQTFSTFLTIRDEFEEALGAYSQEKSWQRAAQINVLTDQLAALIDLSSVPRASRREVGLETTALLLDILGRIELPDTEDIPDLDSFEDDKTTGIWRIPETPIRILKIEDGDREGEFLFGTRTIISAPRFFEGIQELPLRSTLNIRSWSNTLPQFTGPLIPAALSRNIPDPLHSIWFDTPIWKILLTLLLFVLAFMIISWLYRITHGNDAMSRLTSTRFALLPPIATIALAFILGPVISNQIFISGRFSTFTDIVLITAFFLSFAWVIWAAILTLFEWIISSPNIPDTSLDANLLRLCARITGIVAVVLVLSFGAQELGLPVFSLLAGLGIGGLAIALAIRPTLENLIGGFIIYIDKPVRVGDFCNFGNLTGTVEKIGIRSTEIRALDRTIISIPNAKFADMEIINWAECDQMLIEAVIGLRYETTPDQLRYVLAKMREMFHAHPRINNDTVRVRFSGYGDSSLDITIRVYAETREWNDFFAIKEDVLMRVNDIVNESGSGFAFPSQTLYMGEDSGLDKARTETADKAVKSWRRRGKLPFPRYSAEQREEFEDTLDYPPKGSIELGPDATSDYEPEGLSSEPLSDEPLSLETDAEEPESNDKDEKPAR